MTKFFALCVLVTISAGAWAKPHMDLGMTSREYRELLKQNQALFAVTPKNAEDTALDQYLAFGARALDWVDFVNQHRPPENKLSLSSPGTAGGNLPSRPSYLSFRTITEDWEILRALLPAAYNQVIFSNGAFTEKVPTSDRDFVEWLRQVDRAYQGAARYRMLDPWREYYASAASQDVRGYLHLKDVANLDTKLSNWPNLQPREQDTLRWDLVLICRNSTSGEGPCRSELDSAISRNRVLDFKNKYFAKARDSYNRFFSIVQAHPDGRWSDDAVFEFPFTDPQDNEVADFLRLNIEDEWHWLGWQLKLAFKTVGRHTRLLFEAGATPHASLAGYEIVMDSNAPLTEYEVGWAIRHEFGHTLGFVDCYVEFYDTAIESYVSYQLDVTNLMCSRRGHIKQVHFDEMKRVYSN